MIKSIGPHRVLNASIDSPEFWHVVSGTNINVLYSDPPWGDGNLKYWATMNEKMTGRKVNQVDHIGLYDAICRLIQSNVTDYVFIETGLRWEEWVTERLRRAGVVNLFSQRIKYNGDLENVLIAGSKRPELLRHVDAKVPGMTGPAVARRCIEAVATPGGIVIDPCCGMGYTARAAVAANMRFIGNELNSKRLAKTIAFLESTRAAA